MNGRPEPTADHIGVLLTPTNLRRTWCAACKAETRHAWDLVLADLWGVSTIPGGTWCEICETTTIEEAPRG